MSLLRPYWKHPPISEKVREQIYGLQVKNFQLVESPNEADLFVLPMAWNFYYKHKKVEQAVAFVERAKPFNKPIITWNSGDYSVPLPVSDVYLFQANGYQSRRKEKQFAIPSFINDPLKELGQNDITILKKETQPQVGFCGQANDAILLNLKRIFSGGYKKIKFYAHLSYFEPHPLFPPTILRANVLAKIEKCGRIKTDIIKRTHYSPIRNNDLNNKRRQEFLSNVQNNAYTVCVRGTGNFSLRFYEVLAAGRIPVFINTDCILPYDQKINWKKYCVWVELDELDQLPQKILSFHEALDAPAFSNLQLQCRKLWESRLSFAGFHAYFQDHFFKSNL